MRYFKIRKFYFDQSMRLILFYKKKINFLRIPVSYIINLNILSTHFI